MNILYRSAFTRPANYLELHLGCDRHPMSSPVHARPYAGLARTSGFRRLANWEGWRRTVAASAERLPEHVAIPADRAENPL
jgi:hypothetical protein